MAIDNEQSVAANNTLRGMLIKVLQPLQAKLICRSAILTDCNNLTTRHILILLLG